MTSFVDVWRISLKTCSLEIPTLHTLLDSAEQTRANRFRKERDRRRFVIGRGALRQLIRNYTGISPERVRFNTLPGGKPILRPLPLGDDGGSLKNAFDLKFNLSHCDDVVLIAFSDRDVGIDIEKVVSHDDIQRVANQFFTVDEAQRIGQLEGFEKTFNFFRTWVRKEAYVKATGLGFALDPATFRVSDDAIGKVTLQEDNGASRLDELFTVHDLTEAGEHVAAIALSGCTGAPAIHYRHWHEVTT
ncbi:MAG TPA: 4'-phosphopantetheinyl transferase superfamily protein [Gemmatimonadaceae bacterium]|nr:4'-phosphopantetheinyl transferase superfamily protein [Gemmatimonadaceae bacterium]